MDKLKVYWPVAPVQFNGKGIAAAWRDTFTQTMPYETTDLWEDADVAFFPSDSVLDPGPIGRIPTVAYFWGWHHERVLRGEFDHEKLALLRQCTFTLVPSLVTYYQACALGLVSNVLPAGVDADTLMKDAAMGLEKKPQVLFLSRLEPYKGLGYLIQALSALQPKLPLIVSGPGDAAPYRTLADKLGVPATFHQFTDAEKVQAIQESLVLVHPSDYEGFSLPPLEALFLGTPVIVSDIPQHRHLLKDFAAYFDSPDDLVGQIIAVANRYDEAIKQATLGRQYVAKTLTLTRASGNLNGAFHEAIRTFLGEQMRDHPEQAKSIYERDHRRNWVYRAQQMDPTWYRHWRLQHVLKAVVGETMLDVGASAGVYTVALAQNGYKVTWFDHSEEAKKQAQTLCNRYLIPTDPDDNPQVLFVNGDAHALPFPDASFDTVWAGEILEHVKDPAKVFAELVRVAKTKVIATTPIGDHHFDPLHINRWTDATIGALIAPYGGTFEKIAEEGTDESCYFVSVDAAAWRQTLSVMDKT